VVADGALSALSRRRIFAIGVRHGPSKFLTPVPERPTLDSSSCAVLANGDLDGHMRKN
jgi:hypothetical protein